MKIFTRCLTHTFICMMSAHAMTKDITVAPESISRHEFVYSLATQADVNDLLTLMETEAIKDASKLVILPKKFRRCSLEKAVEQQRLFIARENNTQKLIGCQKLFVITDARELDSICTEEIRCCGKDCHQTDAGTYTFERKFIVGNPICVTYSHEDTYLYNGASFTHPDYRQRGVSKRLIEFAHSVLLPEVQKILASRNSQALVLLYGLTKENAGEGGIDRTPSLVSSFMQFCYLIEPGIEGSIEHYRYRAFKPSFDPESEECIPLPDTHSSEGYGCVLKRIVTTRKV
jgi:hypothetical protein